MAEMLSVSIATALSVLWREWNSVDAQTRSWEQMEPYDQVAFEMEWTGIVNGLMKQMDRQQDDMTPEQRRRWKELSVLAGQKQPILDKMFAS